MHILSQTFNYEVSVLRGKAADARYYMEHEVGPRTYWLRHRVGGKTWAMLDPQGPNTKILVNDEALATFLTLKFS